ncbi:glycosyltransferase [Advenella kashmirensis WT001]|uniref:Glycosyltransferase n=1 Tax=Advenella kashmirensis (strain DSM 17095 / LMG 22695 / WT001) TaxID=1036672 RepID=I3UAD4_ADVKW|nr:glycosyltransferase [Advenella kashmirensis]AFK61972.1 glycosyltransferase [Advenella kashmirensis WT001]
MTALACAVNDNAVNDKISIVLLTHSRVGELCRTLGHLLDLPEKPPIIVVDNCSIDNTAERVQAAFPTVKLICTERNLGAAGRNLGVDFVQTPYVAFCDDDTWWAPGALDTAVELLDRHARLSVLNARIVVGPQQMPDPTCAAMASSPLAYHDDIGPLLAGFMAAPSSCVQKHSEKPAATGKNFSLVAKKRCWPWIFWMQADISPMHQHWWCITGHPVCAIHTSASGLRRATPSGHAG